MTYIFLGFIYAFISALVKFLYKKIQIHPITMSLVLTLTTFTIFSINALMKYQKEKNGNNDGNENNNNGNNDKNKMDNPFKNIFTWDAVKLGASGFIIFLILIFAVKKLPLTFVIPLSLIWMIFAVIFSKFMLDSPITKTKIVGLSIVMAGILFMNYHHFKPGNIDFNTNMIIFLIIFIGTQILRGYQLTEIKKLEQKYTSDELLVMDFGINLILIIITFIIYRMNPLNKWEVLPLDSKKIILLTFIVLGSISAIKSFTRFLLVDKMPEILYILISNTSIIFTVLLAYKFLGEELTWNQFVGAGIILYGIYKTNSNLIKDSHHIP